MASDASAAVWEGPGTASDAGREPVVTASGRVTVMPSVRTMTPGATPQAQDNDPRPQVEARHGQRREALSTPQPVRHRRGPQLLPGQMPQRQTTPEDLLPAEGAAENGPAVEGWPANMPPADVGVSVDSPHRRVLPGRTQGPILSQQSRPDQAPHAMALETEDLSALAARGGHLTEEMDLDGIFEALAREIEREYRRFYGD